MAELGLFASGVFDRMISLALQAGALVLLAYGLALLTRRASARLRHLLWLIVVLRLAVPIAIATPLGLLSFGLEANGGSVDLTAPQDPRPADGSPVADIESLPPSPSSTPRASRAPARVESGDFPLRELLPTLVVTCWLLGVLAFAGIVAARVVSARRLLARASKAPEALAREVAELSRRLGVAAPRVVLRSESSRLPAPALFGLTRPILVLPRTMALGWTAAEREPLIVHELVHLRRRDLWISGLQLFVQALYLLHPLVWLANRRLRVERELACDEEVARFYGEGSSRYARALLRIAGGEKRTAAAAPSVALAASRTLLGERIRRLATGVSLRRTPKGISALLVIGALAIVALASARPVAQEPAASPALDEVDLPSTLGELEADPERRAALVAQWLEQVRTGQGDPVELQRALMLVRLEPSTSFVGAFTSMVVGDREQRQAWMERLERLPEDPASLRAAASFFMREDKETAERLLLRGWELQPDEMYWPLELARLEQLRGIGAGEERTRAARKALTYYQVAMARLDEGEAYYALGEASRAAVDAGDRESARQYAERLLGSAAALPRDWNYGNALHDAHTTLGLVALAESDRDEAVRRLLLSGETPGSPQLNSFGPSMRLAADLLAVGERRAVLDYLDRCRAFWSSHMDDLDDWSAAIESGGTPAFGNLHR